MGIPSIHATMPLNFNDNSLEGIASLFSSLTGQLPDMSYPGSFDNLKGNAQGIILGGNLSIIFSLLGTISQPDFSGKLLFIEDLCEQLYHLDRIFYSLEMAGVLNELSGLIVGGMTDMRDTETPFGKSYREIILGHMKEKGIPVAFDFPAGHINDNRAIVFGKSAELSVNSSEITLRYL